MHHGQLRTRLTIQAPATEQDALGQPVQAWHDVCTCWADLRVLSGLETIKADAAVSTTRASARIRWREGVTPDMRVLLPGQAWRITAVLPDVAHRRHVDLALEQVA